MSQNIPNSTMSYTEGFGANEDVSGIGVSRSPQTTRAKRIDLLLQIVVSLYGLGGGKTFLCALLGPSDTPIQGRPTRTPTRQEMGRLGSKNHGLYHNKLPCFGIRNLDCCDHTVEKISHYHAFFAFLLADTVNSKLLSGPFGMISKDHEVQFLTIYYTGYQVLWIINVVTTIRRVDDWKNEPGKC